MTRSDIAQLKEYFPPPPVDAPELPEARTA